MRSQAGPRLVGVQSIGRGRVVAAALSPDLDAVTDARTLESDHPAFEGPTTGAVAGPWRYVIANSQLWTPAQPAETVVVRTPL